ncbi:hypothetical protein [uncultured Winogradskyella sp.]|uniref:hypothetical protein n=1 Tax=uncultured Winogradskyella sp. TaxID=395353 RepID=UPI0026171341|nr:hypothetical protein [uncultured Winogradskyella sp.]
MSEAMARGDAIRLTGNHTNITNIIFNNVDNISFNNFNDVVNYMNSFDEFSQQFSNLGFFGKEIHTLINSGYVSFP